MEYIRQGSFSTLRALGHYVTVLTSLPPDRSHLSSLTNYQSIKEQILKGVVGDTAMRRIDMVHPSTEENWAFLCLRVRRRPYPTLAYLTFSSLVLP